MAFAAGIVCFGIDLFNPGFSVDEEVHSLSVGPVRQWLAQDRWGMYLLSLALPSPPLPFLSGLIGVAANAVGAGVAVVLWGGRRQARSIIAAMLVATVPVLCFVMHFNTFQFGVFVGIVIAICSVAVFVQGGVVRIGVALALLVFAVSVYQSIALVALVVYLAWVLNRLILEGEAGWRSLVGNGLRFAGWFGAGLVLHKVSAVAVRRVWVNEGGYHLVDGVYSGSFLSHYDIAAWTEQCRMLLWGDAWYMGWQTRALVLLSVSVILGRLATSRRPLAVRAFGVLVLGTMVMVPFMLPLVTGTPWPIRTTIAMPMLFGAIAFTAVGVRACWLRAAIGMISFVCLFHFVVACNRLMYADYLAWLSTRDVAVRLQDRLIEQGPPGVRVRLVMLGKPVGYRPPVALRVETIGGAMFDAEQGNVYRLVALLRCVGPLFVQAASTAEDWQRGLKISENMPVWPAPGSVVVEPDGLAIVHFGPATDLQRNKAQ